MSLKKIKVIVVDDSALIRKILQNGLSKHSDIEVIATAENPYEARDRIFELKPDVITLDLEMPRMHGLEFIPILMQHWPLPIIVVSSLTQKGSEMSLKALELGAIDVFAKPEMNGGSLSRSMLQLAEIIRNAAQAKIRTRTEHIPEVVQNPLNQTRNKVIAIGASTGGTEAIREVLQRLPASTPGIGIVQHMPEMFTRAFAERLNRICPELEVREAKDGELLRQGLALIAPGDRHLLIKQKGGQYYVEIKGGPLVCRHRPSVDVMFHSVAETAGKNAVGVLLTGMGADGAKGLLTMRQSGARTIAQDEQSCVVYGMPREAIQKGAAEQIKPLPEIASTILNVL